MGAADDDVTGLDGIDHLPAGVRQGLVVGIRDAITPTGLAYFTMPFSGISSITPTLF